MQSRILIVDDSIENLDLLNKLLMKDYQISVATSGPQAIEIVSEEPPDLILLDVIMPGLDGFETCLTLKRLPAAQDIPIIFLTGKNQTDAVVNGLEVGGADYIAKPFSVLELKARIRMHLDLRQKTLALQTLCEHLALTEITQQDNFIGDITSLPDQLGSAHETELSSVKLCRRS